ncbi:MAG: hypothetical protein A2W11_01985 [Ignavibacteria bacterium RBG_16_35_7]|nr:MAG: hypothetical protein A2W11_01985 [Ignavibacteria bacterium RBG_16_35_7]
MKISILFTFIIFLLPINLILAGTTGDIDGKISDKKTGEPLPFVNLLLEGTNFGAATDLDGKYIILNTSVNKYSVKFQYVGYQIVVKKKFLVTKNLTASTALVSSNETQSLSVTKFNEVLELQTSVLGDNVRRSKKGEVVYVIDSVPVTDIFDSSTVEKFFYFN